MIRKRNKDKVKIYNKAYRAKHVDAIREQKKAYRKKNRPEIVAKRRVWYLANKRRHWASMLKIRYGITPDDVDTMHAYQGGLCALCNQPMGKTTADRHGKDRMKERHIDHDHETGKVRALLCGTCNLGLGTFGHSPERLRRAADYIEHHNGSFQSALRPKVVSREWVGELVEMARWGDKDGGYARVKSRLCSELGVVVGD